MGLGGGLTLAGPRAALSLPSSAGEERKYKENLVDRDKDKLEASGSHCCIPPLCQTSPPKPSADCDPQTSEDGIPVASLTFPGELWVCQAGCCPLPETVPPLEPAKQHGLNANRIRIGLFALARTSARVSHSFLMVNLGLASETNP